MVGGDCGSKVPDGSNAIGVAAVNDGRKKLRSHKGV